MDGKLIIWPVVAAHKLSGKFTEEERRMLRRKAWGKTLAGGTLTNRSGDFGRESVLIFDVYTVEELSILKRMRHAFRMFKAAVARNIGIHPRIIVITLK